jgi:hypothetical protein
MRESQGIDLFGLVASLAGHPKTEKICAQVPVTIQSTELTQLQLVPLHSSQEIWCR